MQWQFIIIKAVWGLSAEVWVMHKSEEEQNCMILFFVIFPICCKQYNARGRSCCLTCCDLCKEIKHGDHVRSAMPSQQWLLPYALISLISYPLLPLYTCSSQCTCKDLSVQQNCANRLYNEISHFCFDHCKCIQISLPVKTNKQKTNPEDFE